MIRISPGKLAVLATLLLGSLAHADSLLLTLSVENSQVGVKEQFDLTLEMYGSPAPQPPAVTIDGLQQFSVQGPEQKLVEVPGGRTVKWVFLYELSAPREGVFKLGPAKAKLGDRQFSSNTLFITALETGQLERVAPPTTPLVHSEAEIGRKILLDMEASDVRPYRSEATTVTLRLLSQLPVEDLRFEDEPAFPGFLTFEFPFTYEPRAQKTTFDGAEYFSYELQKFLLFPLRQGKSSTPPARCTLRVRVPSGRFPAADLILNTERSSNQLAFDVQPVPAGVVVGSFRLQHQVAGGPARTKLLQLALEGEGELSTFDFPVPSVPGCTVRLMESNTRAAIRGRSLHSRKTAEYEIAATAPSTIYVVLPPMLILQFDPDSRQTSRISTPPLPLRFEQEARQLITAGPFPPLADRAGGWVLLGSAVSALALAGRLLRRPRKPKHGLERLVRKKRPELVVSRNAARALYREIMAEVAATDDASDALLEQLKHHLPEQLWLQTERAIRKLEWNAYSPAGPLPLTYGEMRQVFAEIDRHRSVAL